MKKRIHILCILSLAASFLYFGCAPGVSPEPDIDPEVVTTFPASDAVDIAIAANIEVVFNVGLDPAKAVEAASVIVSDGGPVTGTLAYNAATRKVTFNPDSELENNTLHTVTVTTNVGLRANYSWSFTTTDAASGTVVIDAGEEYTNEDYSPDGLDIELGYTWSANAMYRMVSLDPAFVVNNLKPKGAIPGMTESINIPQALVSEGPVTVYVKFFKEADSIGSATYSDTIEVDTIVPVITAFDLRDPDAPISTYSNSTAVNAELAATDANPITASFSNDGGSTWSTPVAYAAALTHTLSAGDALKAVELRVADGAGNIATDTANIWLDTAVPVVVSVSIDAGAEYTADRSVTVTTSSTGSPGTMLVAYYTWNGASYTLNGNTGWVSYADSKAIDLEASEQRKQVTVQLRDPAGNLSTYTVACYDTIYLDSIAPSAASVSSITYSGSDSTYVNNTQTITATGTDNVAIKKIEFYIDALLRGEDTSSPYAYSWVTTGDSNASHSVTAKVIDYSGQSITSAPAARTVDNTQPTGSITINAGAVYEVDTSVLVAFVSPADTGSGLDTMSINSGTYIAYAASFAHTLTTGDGTKTVTAQLKDKAGNASTTMSDTIILDTTPPAAPTITLNVTPHDQTPPQTTATSVTWTWASAGSGGGGFNWEFDDSTPDLIIDSQTSAAKSVDGVYTLYVQERDLAYNFGPIASRTVRLTPFVPYDGDTGVTRNVFGNVVFEWRAVAGATNYRISTAYYLGSWQWSTEAPAFTTSMAVPMVAAKTYRWRVEYYNGSIWQYHPLTPGGTTSGFLTLATQ